MMEKEQMTIIVFSDEMDKALATFNLAIGGSTSGMEVTLFFTFWGLNLIKKNEGRIKSKGIMRRMLNSMNRGGAKRLPLSKFHMLGLGKWMMQKLMQDIRFPQVEEQIKIAKEFGVKFIACTTSVGMMGIGHEAFIPEVVDFAGVATYLAVARDSKVNLFI